MSEVLYDKNIKCPICTTGFSSKKMRTSACRIDKRDQDFCPSYKSMNPIYYEIFVCPQCAYAAGEHSFESLGPKEVMQISHVLHGKEVKRNFCGERSLSDAIDSFKLALYIAKSREAKKSTIAGLALKLAWLYREQKSDKEAAFLEYALDNYKEAYNSEDMPLGNLDEISVQYLIGELSRRLNRSYDAVFWFNKVVSHPKKFSNPRIVKMAREQWALVKEESKK